ncbi:MAG: formate/nitrite family transporter [Desulfococcaceae bacterium]
MKERMLVIDDDPAVLESCKRIFSADGFEVETVEDPSKGLSIAGENDFNVILCDWQMPGMDGLDVVAAIRERSPDAAVVMFTGFPSVDRATEAMKRGAMDYVGKPFTPEEITGVVRRAVRRHARQEKEAVQKFGRAIGEFPVPTLEDQAPSTIADTVASKVGVAKATSPWVSLFVLGVLAGAYIGFGGLFSASVTFDMTLGIGMKKLIGGAAFSLGLMLVVIAGAELFTGNSLMISSVMTGRIGWRQMLERWGVVYLANFLGSLLVALLFYFSGLWRAGGGALGESAVAVAFGKVNLGFGEAFVRAVGCNWLVCLAVWMALSARQVVGKILAIFFPIMGFVAIGFEHSVANMYFIPVGIFLSNWGGLAPAGLDLSTLHWGTFLWNNLVPVTLGNIVGGVVFVGLSYWSAYLRPKPDAVL